VYHASIIRYHAAGARPIGHAGRIHRIIESN
jgi:hypothetical protein